MLPVAPILSIYKETNKTLCLVLDLAQQSANRFVINTKTTLQLSVLQKTMTGYEYARVYLTIIWCRACKTMPREVKDGQTELKQFKAKKNTFVCAIGAKRVKLPERLTICVCRTLLSHKETTRDTPETTPPF